MKLVGEIGRERGIKVAIVDAHPLYRAGVRQVLSELGSIDTLAQGETAAEALQIAQKYTIDILLLDTKIAGGWKQAMASIVGMWPAIKVVVLSASEADEDVTAALQLGARGYILKNVIGSHLVGALQSIESGSLYLTPSLGARLLSRVVPRVSQRAQAAKDFDLTARELEIISQVSVGATNKEVALHLKISEKTVKHYMTNIMQKLQVRNRVEAVLVLKGASRSAA